MVRLVPSPVSSVQAHSPVDISALVLEDDPNSLTVGTSEAGQRHRLADVLDGFEMEQEFNADQLLPSPSENTHAELLHGRKESAPRASDVARLASAGNAEASPKTETRNDPWQQDFGMEQDPALQSLMEPITGQKARVAMLEELDQQLRKKLQELQTQAEEARSAFTEAISAIAAHPVAPSPRTPARGKFCSITGLSKFVQKSQIRIKRPVSAVLNFLWHRSVLMSTALMMTRSDDCTVNLFTCVCGCDVRW